MNPALDTPAKIAVLGAGPIGLEAALYARYLGYTVDVYECGSIAHEWLHRGHLPLQGEFARHCSPLALAALAAQDPNWQPPGSDLRLTRGEYRGLYLLPLAQSDLLDESIHERSAVLAVGVDHAALAAETNDDSDGPIVEEDDLAYTDEDAPDNDSADNGEEVETSRPPAFYLLIDDDGAERIVTADAVLDATGLAEQSLGLGPGGIPAAGERRAARHFDRYVPDVLKRERTQFAGGQILVVGSGSDAEANVVALCQLAAESPHTRVTWIEPMMGLEPCDGRDSSTRLSAAHSAIAEHGEYLPGVSITRVRYKKADSQFTVRLGASEAVASKTAATHRKRKFDRILNNMPRRAAHLLVSSSVPPVRYHILGSKSRSNGESFSFQDGLDQVRRVFAILGGRADLDLYATAVRPT